jgi:membrane-bound metal-dependent hydrolase YbcI (DUF457 family)
MGVSHATSGAAAGLLLAETAPELTGISSARDALTFAAVCAGYALLADLDHPSSTATRRFSWASWLACQIIRPVSALVFRATATHRDHGKGTHRGLTHTALAAAGLGIGVNAAVSHWGIPALWVVLFIGLALAVKGLDELIPGPPSLAIAAALTWLCTGTLPWRQTAAVHVPWLGTAVALGMLVHCCGDALTESGCPLLAPLRINGQSWYALRLPKPMRLRTGGRVEKLVLVALTAATIWLFVRTIPGLWPLLVELRGATHATTA